MRSFIKYKVGVPLGALAIMLFSCTAEQDVAAIKSPANNPLATIEPAADYSTVTEGDTLMYTITVDKMVDQAIDFAPVFLEANQTGEADLLISGGTLVPYSLSTEIMIVIVEDNLPEVDEQLAFDLSAAGDPGYNFQLSPDSDVESMNQAVVNVNDPTLLTIGFEWVDPEHEIDFDLLVESETNGSWGTAATSDNPEIDMSIWNADDDDTFYVGVDPFAIVDGDINFTLRVGYPDGTVEIFEGVFNSANTDSYTVDQFTAWGIPMYRVATVVKTGSNYNVTFEF